MIFSDILGDDNANVGRGCTRDITKTTASSCDVVKHHKLITMTLYFHHHCPLSSYQ